MTVVAEAWEQVQAVGHRDFQRALARRPEDVKVVLEFAPA
jgi:hypothetical protein